MTIAHTDREQLGGHTLELAQTLGDSVSCRRMVSSMAVPIKVEPIRHDSVDQPDLVISETHTTLLLLLQT